LRGLDLNQRPLDSEASTRRNVIQRFPTTTKTMSLAPANLGRDLDDA